MTNPQIVSRPDWLKARKDLLEEEKRIMGLNDNLAAARRELPAVRVETDYVFSSDHGPVSLQDLFGPSRQLIVYHFMFAPDWEEGCKSCSFWADSFNGAHVHLAARDTAFVCISVAPLAKIEAYKKRLGWDFPWVSSAGNSFGDDFGVSFSGPADRYPQGYNYTGKPGSGELPGISVFLRDNAGDILHTYSAYARGVEVINSAYHLLDLTQMGRNEEDLEFSMAWVQRRDAY